jgi:hypothetical protein
LGAVFRMLDFRIKRELPNFRPCTTRISREISPVFAHDLLVWDSRKPSLSSCWRVYA